VSVEHNFFDVGGTSVDMVRVYNKLREVFKREFPLLAIFENPTITSLARYLVQDENAASDSHGKDVARGERRKATTFQKQRQKARKQAAVINRSDSNTHAREIPTK